jgi:CRP/FNR family cyclic AMP-dependent transcriptional regulator
VKVRGIVNAAVDGDGEDMKADSMLARFQGEDGRRRLVDLLRAQAVVGGDATLADELADVKKVRELLPGDFLIEQKSAENDLFFILSGTCRIFVNGREVAIRHAGQHVGEMVIIDPSLRRTATVIASEPTIVACVDEKTFSQMADKNPRLWRALAVELCQRLNERRKFHAEPNTKPILFIGSSKEQLAVAEALAAGVPKDIASVTLWSEGVFGASSFAIESLETQIGIADFAVLVVGPDDQVTSRGVASDAPRDNVVFELGLFMGALSRLRTFLLAPKGRKVKLPTDLLGLTTLLFDPAASNPADMVKRAVDDLTKIIGDKGPK